MRSISLLLKCVVHTNSKWFVCYVLIIWSKLLRNHNLFPKADTLCFATWIDLYLSSAKTMQTQSSRSHYNLCPFFIKRCKNIWGPTFCESLFLCQSRLPVVLQMFDGIIDIRYFRCVDQIYIGLFVLIFDIRITEKVFYIPLFEWSFLNNLTIIL